MNKSCSHCNFTREFLSSKSDHKKAMVRKWVVKRNWWLWNPPPKKKNSVNNENSALASGLDFYASLGFIIKTGRKRTASKAILSCRQLLWLCDMQVLRKSCFRTNMTSFQNAVNQETKSPRAVTEQRLLSLWNALFSLTTVNRLRWTIFFRLWF